MTKIGRKLVSFLIAGIILTAAAVMLITCIMFRREALGILGKEADSAVGIIENEISYLMRYAGDIGDNMLYDPELPAAAGFPDSGRLAEIFSAAVSKTGRGADNVAFCCAVDRNGDLVWESSPGRISDIDGLSVLEGTSRDGLCADSNGVLYFRKNITVEMPDGSRTGLIIGYDVADTGNIERIKEITGGDVAIFKNNRRYATTVMNRNGTSPVGSEMDEKIAETVLADKQDYHGKSVIDKQTYICCCIPFFDSSNKLAGAYYAGYPTKDTDAAFLRGILISAGAALVMLITIIILVTRTLSASFVKPMSEICRLAGDMENGEFMSDSMIHVPVGNDEIGDLAHAVSFTKQALGVYVTDLCRVMTAMSKGDFTLAPQADYHGDFIELKRAAEKINLEMRDILAAMGTSADQVMTGSAQTATGSEALAGGATRQAAAIEQLSESLNKVSENVKATAENAEEAKKLSSDAAEKMDSQHEHMNSMLEAMNEISEKSTEIGKIINAINDIAFQTNILALNAAVEAARAGESGRGFAVVADEVRVLASKCAEAANTTSELVKATSEAVVRGEKIADMNAESLDTVKQIFSSTSDIISEISSSADHQAESIGQISDGINEISSVVQENSASAEEIAASCEQISGQSVYLRDSVKKFKVD